MFRSVDGWAKLENACCWTGIAAVGTASPILETRLYKADTNECDSWASNERWEYLQVFSNFAMTMYSVSAYLLENSRTSERHSYFKKRTKAYSGKNRTCRYVSGV
jgi:hypothetical protein